MICPQCMASNEKEATCCRRCGAILLNESVSKSSKNNSNSAAKIWLEAEADRKSPVIAFLLSLLFPGFGHLYAGAPITALFWSSPFILCLALALSGKIVVSAILLYLLGGWGFLDLMCALSAALSASGRNHKKLKKRLQEMVTEGDE